MDPNLKSQWISHANKFEKKNIKEFFEKNITMMLKSQLLGKKRSKNTRNHLTFIIGHWMVFLSV